jgi:hypothetical protein
MAQVDFLNYFSILFWFFILFILMYILNYSYITSIIYSILYIRCFYYASNFLKIKNKFNFFLKYKNFNYLLDLNNHLKIFIKTVAYAYK